MKKQTNQRWQSSLLAAIVTFLILGAFNSTFAQEKDKKGGFLSSPANRNLWLSIRPDKFGLTILESKALFDANLDPVDEYPKPDFSEMEKQYEIVKYHYDFNFFPSPALIILVKPKVDDPIYKWRIKWYDADGVVLSESGFYGWKFPVKADEPQWISAYCPAESKMKYVKSIDVKRVIE